MEEFTFSLWELHEELNMFVVFDGLHLFQKGDVFLLEDAPLGSWKAKVKENKIFSTCLSVVGSNVTQYNCDCKYSEGPICKHIVAVALAVQREYNPAPSNRIIGEKPLYDVKSVLQEVLEKGMDISHQELLEFLAKECRRSPSVFDSFKLRFSGVQPGFDPLDYNQMIQNALQLANEESDWGDINPEPIEVVLDKLCERIQNLLDYGNWEEAWDICKLIYEKIPEQMKAFAHYTWIFDRFFMVTMLIYSLLQKCKSTELIQRIVQYLMSRLQDYHIINWDLDQGIWRILKSIRLSDEQIAFMDQQLDLRLEKENLDTSPGFDIQKVINWKKEFLIETGREDEKDPFLMKFIRLPEIRQYFVDKEIEAQRYQNAKDIILEGIQKNQWGEEEMRGQKQLLSLALRVGDLPTIRELCRQLFENGKGNFEFYYHLESTYYPEEWEVEVENVIKRLTASSELKSQNKVEIIGRILQKEKYHLRLLELIQKYATNYDLVVLFSETLQEHFSNEVLELFRVSIEHFTKNNTGNENYYQLVKMLKKLKHLEGGEDLKRELVSKFQKIYKRRPRMLAIFRHSFPD